MAKKDKAKKKDKAGQSKAASGLKLPKALQSFGGIDQIVASPLAREILADVLMAAAGAAAAALVKNRPSARQVSEAGVAVVDASAQAASGTKELAQTAAGAVAEVVTDAARQILPSALGGADKQRSPDDRLSEAAYADGGKKKKNRDKARASEH